MTATPLLLLALNGCEFLPFITDDVFDHRLDLDGDGSSRPNDCDDGDAGVNPSADEICDGSDNNCDGNIDENDAVDAPSWYADVDGDGYGFGVAIVQCSEIEGYATADGDCDDQDAGVNPSADEVCDGIDNNCDELVDNDPTDGSIWYADLDGDTYGDANTAYNLCAQEDGTVADATDCDDTDAAVNPSATELCEDEIDNNCNGEVDEDTSYTTQYADVDGDGFGDASTEVVDCIIRTGYVQDATDCDDTNATVNPGVEEVCNDGIDNNCDASPDDCTFEGEISYSDANAILVGASEGDFAGNSLASVGDMDGDGTDDLMVGAYFSDLGETEAGAVYIVSGPIEWGSQSLVDATTVLTGTIEAEYVGCAVASAGDLNNDGWNDVIVGAYNNNLAATGAGAAFILHGPITGTHILSEKADTILTGSASSETREYVGFSVASAGDMNADGFDDLLVGAPLVDTIAMNMGATYLVFGQVDAGTIPVAETENLVLIGESENDWSGYVVANAGDLNSDGVPDLLVGAPFYHNTSSDSVGALYVLYGPQSAGQLSLADANVKIVGVNAEDELGHSANNAGDMNHDGQDDIIIGAPGNDNAGSVAGAAYLLVEIDEGTSIVEDMGGLTTFTGRTVGGSAGNAVIGAGDLDTDGFDDVVIGSYTDNDKVKYYGAAFVFFGPVEVGTMDPSLAETTIVGSSDDEFGFALARVGDLNEDSFPDFVASAITDSPYMNSGSAYLFSWLEL